MGVLNEGWGYRWHSGSKHEEFFFIKFENHDLILKLYLHQIWLFFHFILAKETLEWKNSPNSLCLTAVWNLKILFIDIGIALGDVITDFWQVTLAFFSKKGELYFLILKGYLQGYTLINDGGERTFYGWLTIALNWLPGKLIVTYLKEGFLGSNWLGLHSHMIIFFFWQELLHPSTCCPCTEIAIHHVSP